MATLSKELRNQLENVVLKAREEAERGAAAALESFGVGEAKKSAHLDKAGDDLRKKLRAHGRQLGDARRPDESQEVERLIQECAYEHWHRMLFAQFLAENGFLIEPDSGMDVDFEFCEERARETKSDRWEIAAGFAQRMLTGVFRSDDPVLQLRLPTEFRNRLTALLASLPTEMFAASDSLGWTYQFWQTKKTKDVNASGLKVGAHDLPSVTQLFTEDYMVDFLLDNTLGAWHAGKVLAANPKLAETAQHEDELRQAVALPDCPWKYLRFIKGKDGKWTPAAGAFDGWPKSAAALRALDPCMGSGHFVVALFERLVALRVAEEKMDEAAAVAGVIRDNLFGLEIDPRCAQIAAFNLALAAWRRVGHCELPAMNLACSGLAPNTREADWLAIAGDNQKLQRGMERLYRLFQKAADLGSLINPRASEGDLLVATFLELQPLLEQVLAQRTHDDTAHDLSAEALAKAEMAMTARNLAKAAEILSSQFTLVATNVPYLGRGKQDEVLQDYCERVHPEAKVDLATCFVQRCLDYCAKNGTTALVTPQNWLFLKNYTKFRYKLLNECKWRLVAKLGEEAWWSFGNRGPLTAMLILSEAYPARSDCFLGFDVSTNRGQRLILLDEKAALLRGDLPTETVIVEQVEQLKNPDCAITYVRSDHEHLLSNLADAVQGASMVDLERFRPVFWEVDQETKDWVLHQSSPTGKVELSGMSYFSANHDTRTDIHEAAQLLKMEGRLGGYKSGHKNIGKNGVLVAWFGNLPTSRYVGSVYDHNTTAIIPKNSTDLLAIWTFCSSPEYHERVREINQKIQVNTAALTSISFDKTRWELLAAEKYPHGLPKPFSSDPTQWLFNGHPKGAEQPLQVAVARLAGYRWPRQTGSGFPDCPELGPDGLEKHADKDGVVCFSQVRDEPPAATRLRALLADAYETEWSHASERKIISATGSKAESLEHWLLNDFFEQHCDLFHNRPFAWHIWDGRKDGFNALVNYHKLAGPDGEGHRTLETLAYAYLGDWIARQKDAVAHGEAGADDRLAAALELQGELKKIVAGEPPYDLFVRWKALPRQPIGWDPDINDGVRLNIRPFLAAALSRGKTGAGVLRAKPNIKWEKDRGKEPARPKEDFPWFWKWDEKTVDFTGNGEFDGNRWNDCHYTTAFKLTARAANSNRA
jgi:hypothetical protein